MSMMDMYTREQAEEAIEEALRVKREILEEVRKLDNYIFFMDYYLKTGEALDTEAIDLPEEVNDDGQHD